ncbi:hypothetical protein F3Y22_tig00111100pilonHSYRG00139 [Hibiscus syriacus]|uniref:Uncharacterized protein n=1 Tax=Hibiscus syriacus TaxID=106335 RepID=A0A6A2Z151_HIBSY|nr:hypothetical protein F3Y22_tig00111100pilonHSYRG00139 [Hibiscus syriacus]
MMNSNDEGLGYWLRWQVPVCALIIVAPSVLALYVISKVKTEPLFFNDLWKPQWRKLNPCCLLYCRAFVFICWLGYCLSDEFLKRDVEENVIQNSATVRENDARDKIKLQSRYAQEEIQESAGFWGTSYANYISGAVVLTDIVFSCVLVPVLLDSHVNGFHAFFERCFSYP